MRLSELLGRRVEDVDGRDLGQVRDVRLVRDGPIQGAFGAAFRVDGLIVGRFAVSSRLGYDRRGVRGPWLVAAVARRLNRSGRFVAWEHVDASDEVIRLSLSADELDPPVPLAQLRSGGG